MDITFVLNNFNEVMNLKINPVIRQEVITKNKDFKYIKKINDLSNYNQHHQLSSDHMYGG